MSFQKFSLYIRCPLTVMVLMLMTFTSMADDMLEAKVKSAYLYHLINYIDWPELPDDEFRVCIMGADTIGEMLQELANRRVKNLPLKIQVGNINNPASCQVLFIGRSIASWHDITNKLSGSKVLTVGDTEKFAIHGGMVGFYTSDDGKTKLELNLPVIQAAHLKISSKLMELARIVSP